MERVKSTPPPRDELPETIASYLIISSLGRLAMVLVTLSTAMYIAKFMAQLPDPYRYGILVFGICSVLLGHEYL